MALGGGAFMRWLVQKGGVLVNGFRALPNETPESFSPLPPYEVSKMSSVSQEGAPPDTTSVGTWTLGSVSLSNCEK